MDLVLVALPGSGLPEVAESIMSEWEVEAGWLEIDLTDDDAPDRVFSALALRGFAVDLLVNNAGVGAFGSFGDSSLASHETTMRVNTTALVRLTHRLIPMLQGREAAHILNVSSLSALFPMPCLPIYSATKSFVLTFSLLLREELRGSIGVSALCPNTIRNQRSEEEYIDRLFFLCRRACLYPAQIARAGLDGALRGKAIIVPGAVNKLLRLVAPFVPLSLVAAAIRRLWGAFAQETRDAVPERA
jgi:short-subunit dehydrogenase